MNIYIQCGAWAFLYPPCLAGPVCLYILRFTSFGQEIFEFCEFHLGTIGVYLEISSFFTWTLAWKDLLMGNFVMLKDFRG